MKRRTIIQNKTGLRFGGLALTSYIAISSNVSAQQDITVFDDPPFGDPAAPFAPAFGFDFTRAEFRYAPGSDVLDIRLKFSGIAGDADGDGDPDGGTDDVADYGSGEFFNINFDFENDGFVDYVVASPNSIPSGTSNIPLGSFGGLGASRPDINPILVAAPSATNPDLHIQIPDWSTVQPHAQQFYFQAQAESGNDQRQSDFMTGEVNLSFVGRAQNISKDGAIPDTGVHPNSPPGTITGWDIAATEFRYDPVADTMKVTIDTFGIAGDADGDGDPGVWSQPTSGNDLPNLEGSESIAVAFDFDGDGTFDTVAGISTTNSINPSTLAAEVAQFDGQPSNIGAAFGASTGTDATATLLHNPSAATEEQDFVMVISNWSQLTDNPFQFAFRSFAGSFGDDGFGEDNHFGDIALVAKPKNRVGTYDDFKLLNGELSPDVGIPPGHPNLSGWDFKTLTFVYSPISDKLVINIDFFGIAGDADGDGDPGVMTASSGGADVPDLGPGETITIAFDLNKDGTETHVIGVPRSESLDTNTLELRIADILPGQAMGTNYGTDVVGGATARAAANPSEAQPDFKVTISGWSLLDTNDPSDFSFRVFSGSFVDAGFGEDNIPNPGMPPEPAVLVPAFEVVEFTRNPITGTISFCIEGGLEEGVAQLVELDENFNELVPVTIISVTQGNVEDGGLLRSSFDGTSEAIAEAEELEAYYRYLERVEDF
ncbi:MAG: hypothetical protein ACSHYB_16235 [Roseibacillus sp.]